MEEIFDEAGNLTEEGTGAEPVIEETTTEEVAGAEPVVAEQEVFTEEVAGAEPVIADHKESSGFQKRINRKNAELKFEREERQRLAQENAYLKGIQDGTTRNVETSQPQEPVFPDIDKFDKEVDFYTAVKQYQTDFAGYNKYIINKTVELAMGSSGELQQHKNQEAALKDKMNKLLQAGEAAHDDFKTVVAAAYKQFTPIIGEFASESEKGAEILYQLSLNNQALQRIKSLPRVRAIAELVKIENFLLKKKPTVFVPISRIKGGGEAVKGKLTDIEEMKALEKARYG